MAFSLNLFHKPIVSFESVSLSLRGMRDATEFRIVMKDGAAEVSEYVGFFLPGEPLPEPERRVVCPVERVLSLLNGCRVYSWDGFHGKHPRMVKDGLAFTFRARVNGGKEISASGSQNFPRRFAEFRDGLRSIVRGDGK